jgi:diguanylate cyclase (GGDEF)-like protein
MRLIDFLSKVDILSRLPKEEMWEVVGRLNMVNVRRGEVIFNEGDAGDQLYIVQSGAVAIYGMLPGGKRRRVAEFSPGDFFGEMAIIDNAPRSATCVAREDTGLLGLHRDDFFDLIERHPSTAISVMYRMLNITTQRLRGSSGFLSEMVRWGDEARRRAVTDELTGIYNRRFIEDSLGDYFNRARKGGQPFTIAMADLDFFREINEGYGHPVADRVIVDVVSVFKKHLGERDIAARYGGDEFMMVFPGRDSAESWKVADAICRDICLLDTLADMKGSLRTVSLSIGVASYPADAHSLDALKSSADQALYRAKSEGRNRAVCAG